MERQIVIAGQGRAGTTLFYNMLRATLTGFEMPPHEVSAEGYVDQDGNYCTKRPFDIFAIPDILKKAHGKKKIDLIVTLRDPRDILVSKHVRVPDDYFVGAHRSWFTPKGIEPTFTAAGVIPIHDTIIQVAKSGVFPDGIFALKYEHLVENPDRIRQKLADELDLEFSGSFTDFHKQDIPEDLQRALNGVRPVEKAETPKWKKPEHRQRIIEQFTRYPDLHRVLMELGYEEDESWFEEFKADGPGK